MEWNDPLVVRSLESGTCTMCDNSHDPRDIREHLADVHNIGKSSSVNSQITVRQHTRRQPRRKTK